ncbi:uncharacterized protein [Hoplias malabaricus]|uniref:uncharacterized protein isoform X2 n=1 Tax=Hoplias malabaricus TaxID=27720 RepID=UPI0034623503
MNDLWLCRFVLESVRDTSESGGSSVSLRDEVSQWDSECDTDHLWLHGDCSRERLIHQTQKKESAADDHSAWTPVEKRSVYRMKFLSGTLSVILIISGFMETAAVHFKVLGPDAPLVAEYSTDLVLPCSLQPNISAVDMTVEWIRTDLPQDDRLVHLYEDQRDIYGQQKESYRRRTALFKEELKKGNTSLKLSAVESSDEGDYQCFIQDKSTSWYDDITLHVKVIGLFTVVGADTALVAEAGEDLVLPCSLEPRDSAEDMTVKWSRVGLAQSDTLVHLYEDLRDWNDGQMESYRGRTALFKEELRNGNTSLKLSSVRASDEGVYQCFVQLGLWHVDTSVRIEVKGRGFHSWKIVFICISLSVVTLAAVTVWLFKDRRSKKQLSPAECSAIAYFRLHSEKVRKELNLKKYSTSEEGYQRLIPVIFNCRTAPFAGCNLSEQSITTLTAALQSENCSLKELDLSNNDLRDSGVEKISEGLKSPHCKLETLRLPVCKLGYQSCVTVRSVLETETCSLREMDLSKNDLRDAGVEKISEGLKNPHCKLEKLRLVICNLSVKSCEYLLSALQSQHCVLRELDLTHNGLQDSGVEKLCDALKSSHCKLEILRLALCDLGDNSCESLGSALQSETCFLKELDLSTNDLQDSGVEKISEGLKSPHCKLETLRLSGCLITEKGCSSLASALKSNPSHLRELDLTYNHPEESGEKLLSDPLCSLQTLRTENSGQKWIKPSVRKYVCDVTLDPNTAHTLLILSEGNRKVENVWRRQSYPDRPERFDYWAQVLSVESLTGRCYWEVEWSGERVFISVSYGGIQRKGSGNECRFGFNKNSWSLDCVGNSFSLWHNAQSTSIPAPPSPSKRVGVYLDWEGGTLSFYTIPPNTHTLTHLHTLTATFTEPLYAGFWVYYGSSVRVCDVE